MTKEDAEGIINIMVEKKNYELIINKQKENPLCECNTVFDYAWTTKNDKTNEWEHNFQDGYRNDYSGEEVMEELMECDEYMVLNATRTIFVWQGKKNGG